MRPIDADALHKAYMELRNFKQDPQSGDWISLRPVPLTTVIRILNEAPTIEPKREEWIEINIKDYKAKCSHCGTWSPIMGRYCPNCGCRMKGADDEAD